MYGRPIYKILRVIPDADVTQKYDKIYKVPERKPREITIKDGDEMITVSTEGMLAFKNTFGWDFYDKDWIYVYAAKRKYHLMVKNN